MNRVWPTEHVRLEDLPVQGEDDPHREGPDVHPFQISHYDNPREYTRTFHPGMTFTLTHVPITELVSGLGCPTGVHSAECYDIKHVDNTCGDNGSDDEFNDADYVRQLAQTPEKLPALVSCEGRTQFWGGGHRLAAWHDAGWTHAPVWVPDEA